MFLTFPLYNGALVTIFLGNFLSLMPFLVKMLKIRFFRLCFFDLKSVLFVAIFCRMSFLSFLGYHHFWSKIRFQAITMRTQKRRNSFRKKALLELRLSRVDLSVGFTLARSVVLTLARSVGFNWREVQVSIGAKCRFRLARSVGFNWREVQVQKLARSVGLKLARSVGLIIGAKCRFQLARSVGLELARSVGLELARSVGLELARSVGFKIGSDMHSFRCPLKTKITLYSQAKR